MPASSSPARRRSVTLGDLKAPAALLAAAGFVVMVALDRLARAGRDHHRACSAPPLPASCSASSPFARHRRGAAEPRADLPRARPRAARSTLGLVDDRLRLPVRRPVRQHRHADRRRPPRRPARRATAGCRAPAASSSPTRWRRWAARCSAPRPSPATSRAPPGVKAGGRTGLDRRHRRGAVPADPVLRAAARSRCRPTRPRRRCSSSPA